MSEFNFEQLKDIDFNIPESWIENALIVPPKKRKPAVPVMFYRYVASAAACVILAAAVIFSLIFGINKDVDLTDPDSDKTSAVERATGDASSTDPSGEDSVIGNIPWVFGGDSESSTFVTEPAETDADGNKTNNRSSKSKQRASTPSNGSTKPYSQDGGNPDNGGGSEQGEPVPGGSEEETAAPATAEPWCEEPTDEPIEPMTMGPWIEEPTTVEPCGEQGFVFTTYADASLAQGAVFCRVENQNGVILGSKGIYDLSRTTEKINVAYKDIVYLMYYCPYMLDYGNTYTVIFYNSNGIVIKQETLTVYGSDYYEIY